jgi:geranylgeranyl pyrophosphate synthase
MTDISMGKLPEGRLEYDQSVVQTGEEIRRLLRNAPALIRHITSHLAKAMGKMVRARALLACAIGKDGLVNPDAVKAAAAVELLHLATLVHDDIIDDADQRRGIEALHRKFGEKYAVLCGDYLLCTALEYVSTIQALDRERDPLDRSFPRYLTEVCLGEVRQNQNNRNYRLTEREYFRIIRGKTAALFEASFYVGFMLSGEEDKSLDIYKEIGGNIGIIFQLADDCADYEATRKAAKKPVLSDYSLGVVTLPLIRALKKDETLKDQIAAGMEPGALKAAIREAGGFTYTHAKIEKLMKKTAAIIKSLDIGTQKNELLMRLLEKAAGIPA